MELFPDEVDFWRHLVDALASNNNQSNTHALVIKTAWEGLNCRVLIPEKLNVLAKAFWQLGDVEKARQFDLNVKSTPIGVKRGCAEEVLSEVKMSLHDCTSNGYALWLLKQYDLFVNGGKGKLESLYAPLIVNASLEGGVSGQFNSSQTDSQLQSSQGASQLNSPAKKRRPIRRMAQRRSQDLEKSSQKITLVDVISEYIPGAFDSLDPTCKEKLKCHLSLMNEQSACLIDRIVTFVCEDFSIPFERLKQLIHLSVNEFNCKDFELVKRAALYFPLSMGPKLLEEHLLGDSELCAQCLKYTQIDKAVQLLSDDDTENIDLVKSSVQLYQEMQVIKEEQGKGNIEKARERIDQIDITFYLTSPSVDPDLKELVVETFCLVRPELAASLFKRYNELFWFPTASVLAHCNTVDPVIAASLLLKDPLLPVHQLIWHVIEGVQGCLTRMLEYLDRNSMLLTDNGELVSKIILNYYKQCPEVAWSLLCVLYALPSVLNVDQRFASCSSASISPSLDHLGIIVAVLYDYWNNEEHELNVSEIEQVLHWVLQNIKLSSSQQRIMDLNIQTLKHTFSIPSRILPINTLPTCQAIVDADCSMSVHCKTVRFLYQVQVDQFGSKRKSPDWLRSFKATLKLHWSVFGDPKIFADLALCFHAVVKYSLSAIDAQLLSQVFGKIKRKLKRSLLSFIWSGPKFTEQLEVLEWSLQPGLLQFDLPDAVKQLLANRYIKLLCIALEAEQNNWRLWYLLAEAMQHINPAAALKPLNYALALSGNDHDAQCFAYSLYFLALSAHLHEHQLSCRLQQINDLCVRFEKSAAAHRLVHTLFVLSDCIEVKEQCLTTLFPFIGKPRVNGLSQLRPSCHDRLGDLMFYQEIYLLDAIEFYKQQGNVSVLLHIGQRVKTCGASYLLCPESIVLTIAEAVSNLECSKEDYKKIQSLLRDLPKSDRLQCLVKKQFGNIK